MAEEKKGKTVMEALEIVRPDEWFDKCMVVLADYLESNNEVLAQATMQFLDKEYPGSIGTFKETNTGRAVIQLASFFFRLGYYRGKVEEEDRKSELDKLIRMFGYPSNG